MDHSAKLIAALVLSFAGTAYAGYAQLASPPGFSGNSPDWKFAPSAANDKAFGRVIHQPNGLTANVGGQSVKMPASYRLAANAPRIAAAAIYLNPWVRTAVGIATVISVANVIWDASKNQWMKRVDGFTEPDAVAVFGQTNVNACKAWDAQWFGGGTWHHHAGQSCSMVKLPDADCGVGTLPSDTACYALQKGEPQNYTIKYGKKVPNGRFEPIPEQEFIDRVINPANNPGWPSVPADWPFPESVPLELPPGTALPVEAPVINPAPSANPVPRPLFVPTGNPVKNPNYDPNAAPGPNNQPYIQPGVRIVPTPTPSNPWQVDIQPVDRPVETSEPNPDPKLEPGSDPDPGDKPKPDEPQSLCEKHPDIVACAKLGEPGQATPVPNETKTLTIAPENGFGPSGGSCPPPRTVEVAGLTLSMPFDLLCDFATGLKPVIVGLAWLTAAFTFMGIGRRS